MLIYTPLKPFFCSFFMVLIIISKYDSASSSSRILFPSFVFKTSLNADSNCSMLKPLLFEYLPDFYPIFIYFKLPDFFVVCNTTHLQYIQQFHHALSSL